MGYEHFEPRCIQNTAVALTGGDVPDVFTVAGGPVLLEVLAVEITTAVSANAALIHFHSDPTLGSDTDICEGTAAPDIASAAQGDFFYVVGGSQVVMVKAATGTDLPEGLDNNPVIVPVGGIDLKLSTSDPSTGIGTIFLRYSPLVPGATVS